MTQDMTQQQERAANSRPTDLQKFARRIHEAQTSQAKAQEIMPSSLSFRHFPDRHLCPCICRRPGKFDEDVSVLHNSHMAPVWEL
jgi:hypothetical protein